MTSESKPYELGAIEPIAPAPDADESEDQRDRADRIGLAAAAATNSTPAVGVAAEQMDDQPPETSSDAGPSSGAPTGDGGADSDDEKGLSRAEAGPRGRPRLRGAARSGRRTAGSGA